jgi:preprotein translocase subunit SecD
MLRVAAITFLALAACHDSPAQRGRLEVTYSLDLSKAVDDKAVEVQRDLEAAIAAQQLSATVTSNASTLTITASFGDTRYAVEQIVRTNHGDILVPSSCDADASMSAICFRIAAKYALAVEQAALDRAVATVRARLEAMKVKPSVVARDLQIVVELPATEDRAIALRSVISRAGRLEFKVVDDGSHYMERLFAHVQEAKDPTVAAEVDRWHSGGRSLSDYYLIAHDTEETVTEEEATRLGCSMPRTADRGGVLCKLSGRVVLERYLAKLAETDPRFRVPADRQIGFEQLAEDITAKDRRPAWRTYYLERTPRLTGAAISNASGTEDPDTHRPLVQVELDRRGAQTFGDLTDAIAGHKLAILIDDRIQSAPIVMEAIRGGRLQITMGGDDRNRVEQERDQLVKVLKTGALPAALVEESLLELP